MTVDKGSEPGQEGILAAGALPSVSPQAINRWPYRRLVPDTLLKGSYPTCGYNKWRAGTGTVP